MSYVFHKTLAQGAVPHLVWSISLQVCKRTLAAIACTLFAVLLWSFWAFNLHGSAEKGLYPEDLVALRFIGSLVSSVVIGLVFALWRRESPFAVLKSTFGFGAIPPWLVLAFAAGPGLGYVFFTAFGAKLVSPLALSSLTSCSVGIVLVTLNALFTRKLSWKSGLAIVGLAFSVACFVFQCGVPISGIGLVLLATTCYCLASRHVGAFKESVGQSPTQLPAALYLSLIQGAVPAVPFLAWYFSGHSFSIVWAHPDIVWQHGFFVAFVAHGLYYQGGLFFKKDDDDKKGPLIASGFQTLVPICSLAGTWYWDHSLGWALVVAPLGVIVGTLIVVFAKDK